VSLRHPWCWASRTTDRPDGRPDHAASAAGVLEALDARDAGLTGNEVTERRAVWGPNTIAGTRAPGRWHLLLEQLRDVLLWVLVVAAGISGFVLGQWIEAAVILAIVALNVGLGYVQRARAEDALAMLRDLTAPTAAVLRDGVEHEVPAAELVPGDVIALRSGARVPADARLLDAHDLSAQEAALTGESLPVPKQVEPVAVDAALGDRSSMVFLGTMIAAGRGRAVITATGGRTAVGGIAQLVGEQEDERSPLQVQLAVLGRRLVVLAVGVGAIVFVLGALRGYGSDEMFLTAVALAVAAIPEGLPVVVTVALARGMHRMAEQHALVRHLPAVETLGGATVICTDKTGTLTENELQVQLVFVDGREQAPEELDPEAPAISAFAVAAVLCNDAQRLGASYIGDATEVALLQAVERLGVEPELTRARFPRVDEIAFDSRTKRMATLHDCDEGALLVVKGAPETVAARCSGRLTANGVAALDDRTRGLLGDEASALAARGYRTLALAQRSMPRTAEISEPGEHDLVWVALVGMLDPLRPEARAAVDEARDAGVRVVMVTGDHPGTAATVAAQVGIEDGETLLGAQLRDVTDDELAASVGRYGVYARIDPADKVKIVRAWKARGEIVAMTGDGVNDAPALRAAHIGVAMGSGTDAGKEAADMILADDNFATIVAAIREGRRIFANLQKVIAFLVSANAAEVLLITTMLVAFGDLGAPLLATQILWVNLVSDGLPVLALAMDPAAPDVMRQPPERDRALLALHTQARLVGRAVLLAGAALVVLAYGEYVREYPWPKVRTLVFCALVVVQLWYAIDVHRSGRGRSHRANPLLSWSLVGSFALTVAIVQTSIGERLFDTVPLGWVDWVIVSAVTGAAVLALTLGRRLSARLRGREASPALG
jgi:Ca2+-transporting ATPase